MPSLIEGYNYDIFISYRQKDNKGDHWVSEFVEALKTELESTFKEEISVYFDINPHDGLLETHDVDASLKEKLKCLIFIPIISRTYCDPKSFAWEHEFKAFSEMASKDQFGLKVKLLNGNVANRILPVQIHELDLEDKKLIEDELGGHFRGVEFIYKEPGVNRPLALYDDGKLNINKTRYRNQINKVANAINEIVVGLKNNQTASEKDKNNQYEPVKEINNSEKQIKINNAGKLNGRKLLSVGLVLVLTVILTTLVYPKIFKKNRLERLKTTDEKTSVAVMPFQNMTNDTTLNVWQDGIQNELINNLTNTREFKVRQTESIIGLLKNKGLYNYASITRTEASALSQKLEADIFILGTIKKGGSKIRVNAQIIDSKTEEIYRSFQVDGLVEKIIHTVDSLSTLVKNFLLISKMKKEDSPELQTYGSTNSPEAYRYYILGKNAYYNSNPKSSIEWLNQACSVDSNFTWAMWFLSVTYMDYDSTEAARKVAARLYRKKESMPIIERLWVNFLYTQFFQLDEAIESLRQLQEIDGETPLVYLGLGYTYLRLQQYDKAIPEYEKAFDLYSRWESKPPWASYYVELGAAYHKTGQYKKEMDLYNKAEQNFPDDPDLIYMQAILSLTQKDTIASNQKIERFITVRSKSWTEQKVTRALARIYSEAHYPEKAGKLFRKALYLAPEDPYYKNSLAYFLIDKDRNINEGLNLINECLKTDSDNYDYLNTKGLALYKLGQYKKAFEVLEKSWLLRKQISEYNHDAFLLLEAAKKVARSNN